MKLTTTKIKNDTGTEGSGTTVRRKYKIVSGIRKKLIIKTQAGREEKMEKKMIAATEKTKNLSDIERREKIITNKNVVTMVAS